MRAVLPILEPTAPPRLGEVPDPVAHEGEVVVEVKATAINHADLLQQKGLYPPPPGESEIPGLECSGSIREIGRGVEGWRAGERVMALLAGGGHAQRVSVPAGQLMRVPAPLTFTEAAAIPEAGLTAWTNLVAEGGLRENQTVLVTGAGGGMGTMIVQLARELGARVFAAGRDPSRLQPLRELGAEGLCKAGESMAAEIRELSGGSGADLVIDLVGGTLFPHALRALAPRGRLVLLGLLAGTRAEIDLGAVLMRRLSIVGSVLRVRSREEKAALTRAFATFALPRFADGRLRPVIDRVLPFERIHEGYRSLAAGGIGGKIVVAM